MGWRDGLLELAAPRVGPEQCAVVLTSTMRENRVQGVYPTLEQARAAALEAATTEVAAKRTCVPYLVETQGDTLALYQAGRWDGSAWVEDNGLSAPISVKRFLGAPTLIPGRPLRPSSLAERTALG